ncbi:MAG: hypothetical protein AB3N23_11705 [Paracoccaceae bacterium]
MNPLDWAARHGPYVLIGGLVVGIAVPALASAMRPWMPQLVVMLLFVSVLRMEPRAVLRSLTQLRGTLLAVLLLQLAAPLLLIGGAVLLGWQTSPYILALMLMLAAPSIVGSPNICMMMGVEPNAALRLMVIGTALLPLTVVPVFWAVPAFGDPSAVLAAALRLFLTITLTTAAALATRHRLFPNPSPDTLRRMEGASAIALAVFVIGLMEAVSQGFADDTTRFAVWLALAFIANFGAQFVAWRALKHRVPRDEATAISVISGNRNVSLYFVSLPPEVIAPLLVFIGCYQIPMYLTPLVMQRLYRTEKDKR